MKVLLVKGRLVKQMNEKKNEVNGMVRFDNKEIRIDKRILSIGKYVRRQAWLLGGT